MTEYEWLNHFGDALAEKLKDARMTQRELADATGLDEGTISRYIRKQRIPTVRAIINICYELACDTDELIDFGERIY